MSKPKPENPFVNILINVIIPVLALSYLSKDPNLQAKLGETVRPWHIGPLWAMIVGICLPLCYGIYDAITRRKLNFFSILGIAGVALTGGLTLYVVGKDGSINQSTPELFGLKEASIPLIFAIAFAGSFKTKTSLIRTFLYTPDLFDVPKIENRIRSTDQEAGLKSLLWQCSLLMATAFIISAAANYFLAKYFLDPVLLKPLDQQLVAYNQAVGKLLGWGFAVIGAPMLLMMLITFYHLVKGLKKLSGLQEIEELLMPR